MPRVKSVPQRKPPPNKTIRKPWNKGKKDLPVMPPHKKEKIVRPTKRLSKVKLSVPNQ